jgi:CO/xanthine dehydrogenase Mo-binding subunit
MAAISRRGFLMTTGWVAGGVTVLYALRNRAIAVAPTIIFPDAETAAAWVQLHPDGSCRFYSPRMDMGQNANTGLAQIVAEELNIDVDDMTVVQPSTSDVAPLAVTAGSMSLTAFSRPTSIAAAALREHMRDRAARILDVPSDEILDEAGGFRAADGRHAPYGDLLAGESAFVELDEDTPLPRLYTFDTERTKKQVGRPVRPLGIRSMVTGIPLYAADVPMEGVLHGGAIHPPVHNAELVSVETSGVNQVPGFVKMVQEDDFVGVVCRTPGAVRAAVSAIRPTWKVHQPIEQAEIDRLVDVDAALADGELEHTLHDEAHRPHADWAVDLRFDVQVQSHAAQEARAAIARFNEAGAEHRLEIWTGTQDPFGMKRFAAMHTGLDEREVVIHPQRLGGGFGGREHYEVEKDAVRLAAAVGRPVKVQWTRRDEFLSARNRPASAHRLRLATDDSGDLTDWWHAYVTGHVVFARERLPGWLLPVARLAEDFGVVRGAHPVYGAEHQRVEYKDVDLPVDLGVWRSLNAAPAIFAIESAMDELALRLGRDSVDYRISQMRGRHPRLQRCLERVREMSAQRPLPQGEGYGRGFACGVYEGRCFVAVSADVHFDRARQRIRVIHMCCAQDVGMAVNPDQLRAQMESNMAWSVGMALIERLEVGDDDITSSNFDNYPVPRMADVPSVDAEVIDQPASPPAGAGEVALIAGPPAIANALRRATGFRALALPIRFADVATGPESEAGA